MNKLITLIAVTTLSLSAFAADSNSAFQAGSDAIRLLVTESGGNPDQKIHLLGTDRSGRLCEVLLIAKEQTIGWAFDNAQVGAPEYADNYFDINTLKSPEYMSFKSELESNRIHLSQLNTKESIMLEMNPTYGKEFFGGDFVYTHGAQTLECKLQQLIRDNTTSNDTGILLRTGIRVEQAK